MGFRPPGHKNRPPGQHPRRKRSPQLHTGFVRVTQAGVEVASTPPAVVRATQAGVEVVSTPPAVVRTTQAGVEVVWSEFTVTSLDAKGVSQSAGTAKLSFRPALASAGAALGAGAATLQKTAGVRALGTSTSNAVARLSKTHAIPATGASQSVGTVRLSKTHAILATGGARSAGVAALGVTRSLAAVGLSVSAGAALLVTIAVSLDQLKYRWALDDAVEGAATWDAAEDTPIAVSKGDRRRARIMVNATGNPSAFEGLLQFRRKDIADSWRDVELED